MSDKEVEKLAKELKRHTDEEGETPEEDIPKNEIIDTRRDHFSHVR
ncbi:MAG TPA: hypothetical protein PLP18_00405 [Smithellaceae bacterium]|nr:hypothetical protein [Smithellaceae bacterium]